MSKPTASAQAHGDELLNQLRKGWAPLPFSTLLAMAIGGLKVRMMRSTVTMVSVVLAIAFLSYTGLTNYLTLSLALALREYQKANPVEVVKVESAIGETLQASPIASMPVDRQLALGDRLELDDTEKARSELLGFQQKLENARRLAVETETARKTIENDAAAMPVDKDAARRRASDAARDLGAVETRQTRLKEEVELGDWVRRKGPAARDELAARLRAALESRFQTLIGGLRSPGRLSAAELDHAEVLVASSSQADAAAVLRDVLAVERTKRSATELQTLLRRAGVNVDQTLRGNPMDTWLIVMAMLTCAIGIANAMLMSVTERFREIGTMKCLGAQDNLVVKLFLLESAFQGVIGALIGMVLGILVAILGAVLQFKEYGTLHFPWADGWKVLLSSVIGGIVLTLVGAAGPALKASRMRPVDALRVDE